MSKNTLWFKIIHRPLLRGYNNWSNSTDLPTYIESCKIPGYDNPNLWHGRQGLAPGKQAATDLLVQKIIQCLHEAHTDYVEQIWPKNPPPLGFLILSCTKQNIKKKVSLHWTLHKYCTLQNLRESQCSKVHSSEYCSLGFSMNFSNTIS